jgi:flagellar assembly protein FliH
MSSSFEFPELRGAEAGTAAESLAAADAERAATLAAARAAGQAEGLEAARAELRPAAEALAAAARELDAERERALAAVESDAAELALQLADKVVGTALGVRPELVVEVVRSALRRLAEQRDTAVLVNPDDLERIRAALDSLQTEAGMPLTVRAERRVPSGGCLLRTQAGEIDARIGEQLDRAREVVEAALAG